MKTQNGIKLYLQYLVKEVFCKNVAACNCMAKVFWKKYNFWATKNDGTKTLRQSYLNT